MSVRHGLLALLSHGPTHGYQLKQSFEERTGALWPLNIGQVYTTLARLEREGLVTKLDEDERDRTPYELTEGGRTELDRWIAQPVEAGGRDELVTKVLMALEVPGVRMADVLQRHRRALIEQLQRYTRLKADADPTRDLSWLLTVDALVLRLEAMIHWLDQCEGRLARAGSSDGASSDGGKRRTSAAPARAKARR
jgi:DNA-binding PadR family transcriptional regulator